MYIRIQSIWYYNNSTRIQQKHYKIVHRNLPALVMITDESSQGSAEISHRSSHSYTIKMIYTIGQNTVFLPEKYHKGQKSL
jgi:hypothetical protein